MDGTEPYGGYTDYDPAVRDSAMPPEAYGPGGLTSPSKRAELEAPAAVTAYTHDSRRLIELDLDGDGYSLPEKYASAYSNYSEIPLVPVFSDPRRTAVHPLVIMDAPAGVDEERWARLDFDGISARTYNPFDVEEDLLSYEVEEEPALGITKALVPSSGGSGGSVVKGGEDKTEEEHDPTEMPFLDHLEEFRWVLLKSITAIAVGMIGGWFVTDYFFKTFTTLAKKANLPLITTTIFEALMIKFQMALLIGLVIAAPFVFYYIWSFISPGLYQREKKWVKPLVFGSTGCFLIGASIAYFLIIPMSLMFLKSFIPKDVTPMITIGNFIGIIIKFIIMFGVMFELPMITYGLAKVGLIKHTWMVKYRKYAIVIVFIVGGILTPPDPYTQFMMAIPLMILYEVSIVVARIAGRNALIKF